MNIHNRFRTIWFARVCLHLHSHDPYTILTCVMNDFQSGQSLIEHSYKADSDLSPAGWEYAEKLKDTVLSRRMKVLQERGIDPAQRKLVVRIAMVEKVVEADCTDICSIDLDFNSPKGTSYCLAVRFEPTIGRFRRSR